MKKFFEDYMNWVIENPKKAIGRSLLFITIVVILTLVFTNCSV